MTNRERRQEQEWKSERQKIDHDRVERAKKESGGWKREWDCHKDEMRCAARLPQPHTAYWENIFIFNYVQCQCTFCKPKMIVVKMFL